MDEESKLKLKIFGGIFLTIFGGFGLGFMSWFHNLIGWYPFGINPHPGYDIQDQICGFIGFLLTIVGVFLIYLGSKKSDDESVQVKEKRRGYKNETETLQRDPYERSSTKPKEELKSRCPECGEEIKEGWNVCTYCGTPLKEDK